MTKIKYHLAEDTIDKKDIDHLIEWLKTYPRLTKDKLTLEFEANWSQWLGRQFSVFCNSGSSANLLMFYALLLSKRLKNKKIIVPSVGWVTTIAPAIQFGFEPIMCEADPDTFGLDLKHLETLLEKHKPSTVIMVQVLGVPHKMNELKALQQKYGFFLLEDACASIGSTYQGQKIGTFGDMASFSFYFGHQMSTIEGGMISTDDPDLRDLLLMLRSHGWGKDLSETKYKALVDQHKIDDFSKPFIFFEAGFNLRSTDLNAKIGLGQLEKLEWMTKRRHENHMRYFGHLKEQFCVQKPTSQKDTVSSISFGVIAKDNNERRQIVTRLQENGIETRMFSAGNLGLHPFWTNYFGKTSFTMADRIHHGGFFLPNHPSLKLEDVDFISQVVLDSVCAKKS